MGALHFESISSERYGGWGDLFQRADKGDCDSHYSIIMVGGLRFDSECPLGVVGLKVSQFVDQRRGVKNDPLVLHCLEESGDDLGTGSRGGLPSDLGKSSG